MRTPPVRAPRHACRAHGFILISAMLMLVTLSLLGVSALGGNVVSERIAVNGFDRTVAELAAEACLRDAQHDISGLDASGRKCSTQPACRAASDGALPARQNAYGAEFLDGLRDRCDARGRCHFPSSYSPAGTASRPFTFWSEAGIRGVNYGTHTGADWRELRGVAKPPEYWIEIVPLERRVDDRAHFLYRVTCKGYGRRVDTVAVMQTTLLQSL